ALDTDLEVVQRLPHDVGSPEGIALRVPIELQPLAGMPILEQDVRALDVPAAVDLFEIEDLRVKIDGLLQIGDANSNVAEPEVVHDQRGVAPTEERFPGIWLIPEPRLVDAGARGELAGLDTQQEHQT